MASGPVISWNTASPSLRTHHADGVAGNCGSQNEERGDDDLCLRMTLTATPGMVPEGSIGPRISPEFIRSRRRSLNLGSSTKSISPSAPHLLSRFRHDITRTPGKTPLARAMVSSNAAFRFACPPVYLVLV